MLYIRNLKQTLNDGFFFKKVHRVIKFNRNAWLKSYIDMNIDLRKKAKNDFEKDFFKLMYNAIFGKTMENVRKHRNIKKISRIKKKLFGVRTKLSKKKRLYKKKFSSIEMKLKKER